MWCSDLKVANVLLRSQMTDSRGFICKVCAAFGMQCGCAICDSGMPCCKAIVPNFLVWPAQICDFGLSRILEADIQSHVSATTHGTASWMPPEVLDKGLLTRAADVFSFGLMMWSLVAGEVCCPDPFALRGFQQLLQCMESVIAGQVSSCENSRRPNAQPARSPLSTCLRCIALCSTKYKRCLWYQTATHLKHKYKPSTLRRSHGRACRWGRSTSRCAGRARARRCPRGALRTWRS